ncbi:MAG: alpha/beta fold hydrolase [Clostridia bacterium]
MFLGDAGDGPAMMEAGATRLIDLRGETTPPGYRVPVEHFPLEDLRYGQHEMLLAAARRLKGLAESGETVGVYCQAGVSRTAAVAALYLMLQGLSRTEALDAVRQKRPEAHPALRLEHTLDDLERELAVAPEAFSVDVAGIPVAGVHRPGSGPPLVLFHGAYGDWTHWARNLDDLAHGADVYALDLPGFGDSGDLPEEFSYPRYLDVLAAAVRSIAPDPVVVGGYSFGASLAARLAVHEPALVRGVLLVSLVGRTGDPATHHKVEERHFQNPSTLSDRLGVLSDNLRHWHVADPATVDDRLVAMTYKSVFFTRLGPRRLRTAPHPPPTLEVLERLHRIPVLMVWGERDAFCQPSAAQWAEACARVLPASERIILRDAAHFCQWEQPQAFSQAVWRFLSTLAEESTVEEGGSGGGR